MMIRVRALLLPVFLAAALAAVSTAQPAPRPAGARVPITVYKTATCGCCAKWVDHMKAHGFEPAVQDLRDLSAVKMELRVPASLQSCHTAIVDGYAIEGHVPADAVTKLLAQKPRNVAGLAVPGMPIGSPGMEQGAQKDPYEILAFDRTGKITVFDKR
jgi:hypothetical protein